VILTASGGPFRNTPREALEAVTPADALRHPTWKMGNRITIDSATLMNKGFEVIEAHWLFGFGPDEIEVVVHPQSTIHAMVEYNDGSVIAQVSATDMRMPIQYALTWPERASAPVPKIDWAQARQWEFFPPDFDKFPCLRLAYQCLREGGASSCILNAADEVAVGAFLGGRIGFPAIAQVVEETLARIPKTEPSSISDVLQVDGEARRTAEDILVRNAVRFQVAVPSAARA
jgi:1-deoxy-D-xylulose-5-phosphate reductoisomerase